MDKYYQAVKAYFEKYDKKATIILKGGEKIYIASPGNDEVAAVGLNEAADGEALVAQSVFAQKKDINAVIISSLKFSSVVADTGVTTPPLLDDLAQIVGPSVRTASYFDAVQILKKLKGRNACLVKGKGAVAVGRTLDEADTATLVLEKAAKAFVEAAAIGGVKPIRKLEAVLMHIVYKNKYSKIDQTEKIKEMQND
ncbi:MAG: class II aldolase/adducin family protein [Christensenellales bacterium]|jgi:ribulose-5-phosphate 4-epimerase/fuculose-1-phosphate aldolase|nr:hypothetical protein [Clostridiales bacterium]